METFVTIIHVIVAIFIILVVLVQGGNSGGVGAAFGGGNSSSMFGASGGVSFFGRLTYISALLFMFTSMTLTVLQSKGGKTGLSDRLKKQSQGSAPVVSPLPSSSPAGAAVAPTPTASPTATP